VGLLGLAIVAYCVVKCFDLPDLGPTGDVTGFLPVPGGAGAERERLERRELGRNLLADQLHLILPARRATSPSGAIAPGRESPRSKLAGLRPARLTPARKAVTA
jgi:hypothetical protein